LQVVVLREALQGDIDRALKLVGGGVYEVGKDAAFGSLADVGRIPRLEQGEHGTAGLADDLLDQLERMFGGQTEADESDIWLLACGDLADCGDVDLSGDGFVPKSGDEQRQKLEPVAALVRDQNSQMLNRVPVQTLHGI